MGNFEKNLAILKNNIEEAIKNEIKFGSTINAADAILSYGKSKNSLIQKETVNSLIMFLESLGELDSITKENIKSKEIVLEIKKIGKEIKLANLKSALTILEEIENLAKKIKIIEPEKKQTITLRSNIPEDIKQEILADIKEIEKTFECRCYRSTIIFCGRIMEVVLHRKYFDATGIDLLEKSPGIGLGNLIAKLNEKGVQLDPGITQQVHLINNIRIFSVHKKQQPFYPTKEQAHAIMLYTLDVLNRIF